MRIQFDVIYDAHQFPFHEIVHKLTGANANKTSIQNTNKHSHIEVLLHSRHIFLSEHMRKRRTEAAKDMLDVDKKSNKTQYASPIAISTHEKKQQQNTLTKRKMKTNKKEQNCRVLIYDRRE